MQIAILSFFHYFTPMFKKRESVFEIEEGKFLSPKFDSNGVAIVGLDFERHLIAIDAENGKSLVQPSRFSLESERFEVAGPGKNQTGSLFPRVMIRGLVRDLSLIHI